MTTRRTGSVALVAAIATLALGAGAQAQGIAVPGGVATGGGGFGAPQSGRVGINGLSGGAYRNPNFAQNPRLGTGPGTIQPGPRPGGGWGRGGARFGGGYGHRGYGNRGYGVYPGVGLGLGLGYGYGAPYAGYGYDQGYLASGYDEGPVDEAGPSEEDAAYCAKRFKTYDPRSGTYVGKGGRRIACP